MSSNRGPRVPVRASRSRALALLLAAASALALGMAGAGFSAFGQEAQPEGARATPAPQEIPAGPRDGTILQDWRLRCQLPRPDLEVCEMRQRIVDQNGNTVVLAVVGRPPNIDVPGLLILLPLGLTSLPPGAFLKIDQGAEQRVQIERCEVQGCHIELLLDDNLLPRLKAGSKATVGFYVYNDSGQPQRVDVPISLIGFSAALAEVMQ